ncbi:hypothetical protein [Streptomyces sp. ITFR-16]|uniref:hypothetical protein n=1 Tax=Streptomyces sp. ITFR-16 TaxID=3075198 RepID=UPI0028897F95|nr:hypothetical protein [Streptomyces sp. ITFR-16]WNI21355.1 hypothetical protein RLT58_05185 [Streptomyces sp. ITFR-16]
MSTFARPAPGDPVFGAPSAARPRRAAHRAVQDHLPEVIAASPWGDGPALRGSLPLRAWLGTAAREPGDDDADRMRGRPAAALARLSGRPRTPGPTAGR